MKPQQLHDTSFEKIMMIKCAKAFLFCFTIVICTGFPAIGQPSRIDSLISLVKTSPKESLVIDALNELALVFSRSDTDSARLLAQQALILSKKTNYVYGEAMSHRMTGIALGYESNLEEALLEYDLALDLFKSINHKLGKGIIYNNYGLIYQRLGRYAESINSYNQSRIIAEELNDHKLMSKIHNNLGIVMERIGEYDSAIAHYFKSIDLKTKKHNHLSGSAYNNIGLVKFNMGEYKAAEEYYLKSMEIYTFYDDSWGIANGFENIGELKYTMGEYEEASTYFEKARSQFVKLRDRQRIAANDNFLGMVQFQKRNYDAARSKYDAALEAYKDIGDQRGVIQVLRNMARCEQQMKHPQRATKLATESFQIALKLNAIPQVVQTADLLHKIYSDQGNDQRAYEHAMTYLAFKDSLYDRQKLEYITRIEARHQLSQIQQQNQLLTKENELKINELQASNLKIERQNAIQFALIICLMFAILTAIFWYRFNLKKQRTIKILRRLNDEIISQKEQIASQADELEKVNTDMKNMNESLEVLVRERTKKIESQNEKLREYAFSNSHEVRAPLANLLGLINVAKIQGMSPQEQEEIIEKIYISALDLDSVITKVNRILEEEGL